MALSVLKIEIDELKNSIQHLERSNRELKDLLQTDPDPEYRIAIGENITTLAKKRARVAALEEELRRLTGEEYESDAVAVPVSEEGAPGAALQEGHNSVATRTAAGRDEDMQTEEPQVAESHCDMDSTSMEVDAAAAGPGAEATAAGVSGDVTSAGAAAGAAGSAVSGAPGAGAQGATSLGAITAAAAAETAAPPPAQPAGGPEGPSGPLSAEGEASGTSGSGMWL
ncbi:hypothetical protein PLESTB_001538500 [Pleodorina starrii]|uniref:Uncharacterized protein n=1 Tax=Pleodorina starrii TaxID=330485 RepID=A0A9W6BX00_9CHLO|nr:hypothetical protein PLESTM_001843700 [Pleodorina starrii]GLC59814.1 hypothetical protein PLESTB_001538500 [Pleodorina starrii]GLC67304.1 hypothetical protein PLESTF_000540400 [Pleodorina starrii]